MNRRIALLDWDGTLTVAFTFLRFMDLLIEEKVLKPSTKQRIMDDIYLHHQDKLTYDEMARRTLQYYAEGLKGVRRSKMVALSEEFVSSDKSYLFPHSHHIFEKLKDLRIGSVLLSGSPQEILDVYQKMYGFHRVYGLRLGYEAGVMLGKVELNTAILSEKEKIVEKLLTEGYRVELACGDSVADVPLLQSAQHCIIVNNDKLNMWFWNEKNVLRINTKAYDEPGLRGFLDRMSQVDVTMP
ncbi:MAG: hypothetical protein C0392_12540 [Syntrophus sp. (in: bacteria)]|nr:hypothetical protein [Syntrophus sp. (in: bacteria)]